MNRLNFAKPIALMLIVALIIILHSDLASCQITDSEYTKKQRAPLTAFKAKHSKELGLIPRLRNLASMSENHDSAVLAESGRTAWELGNLEEAEGAFATSLSLRENGLNRLIYSEILIEEKKYLEALPSCAEAALFDRFNDTIYSTVNSVELTSTPHILLAYVLAQIGDLKTSAIVYKYARDRRMSEMDQEIAKSTGIDRQLKLNVKMMMNLPEIPKEFDPQKTTSTQLLQALRLLRCVRGGGSLTVSMIKEAYLLEPDSPLVAYLRGICSNVKANETFKERLSRNKTNLLYVQIAAKLVDPASEFGKLVISNLSAFEKNIKEMEDYIQEHRAAFDNMP